MRTIYDGKLKLATLIRKSDISEGLNFHSEDSDFIQVGTWRYDNGKKLDAHVHNVIDRKLNRTQEVICIIQGAVKVFLYSEKEKLIEEFFLLPGDSLICWNGGHGYKICNDDTIVLEVKNGPFLGVEKDKRKI